MPVSEYFLYEKESIDDEYQQSGRELTTIFRPLAQEPLIGSSRLHAYTTSAAVKMTEILFGRVEMRNCYKEVFFQLMITEISS
jgi:hypothetical protein